MKEISEVVKNRLIGFFINTKLEIKDILDEVVPGGEITEEDLHAIIKEYKEKTGKIVRRKNGLRNISQKEIWELVQKGFSTKEIVAFLQEKGIFATVSYVQSIIDELLRQVIDDKEIYELREKGNSYRDIAVYYRKKRIKISVNAIMIKCKKIYEEKGKKEPYSKKKQNYTEIPENVLSKKICNLREQGLSYVRIVEELKKEGIEITKSVVASRCKKAYADLAKEEPKVTREVNRSPKNYVQIKKAEEVKDTIFKLREQGISYCGIEMYFYNKGIIIRNKAISDTCKKIYTELGREEPKTTRVINFKKLLNELGDTQSQKLSGSTSSDRDAVMDDKTYIIPIQQEESIKTIDKKIPENDAVKRVILNLRETRGATDEQLQKLADYYGINWKEINVDMNENIYWYK